MIIVMSASSVFAMLLVWNADRARVAAERRAEREGRFEESYRTGGFV